MKLKCGALDATRNSALLSLVSLCSEGYVFSQIPFSFLPSCFLGVVALHKYIKLNVHRLKNQEERGGVCVCVGGSAQQSHQYRYLH